MKTDRQHVTTIFCASICGFLFLIYAWIFIFHLRDAIHTNVLLALTSLLIIFSYLTMRLMDKYTTIHLNHHHVWQFMAFIYFIFLLYLLFLSPSFSRTSNNFDSFSSYLLHLQTTWNYQVNLIPFSSIREMITLLHTDGYTGYAFYNLFGNFIAFMPFALFLKMIDQYLTIRKFLCILVVVVASIECIQFLTTTGSMDIDDLILNVAGSLCLYGLLSIPKMKTFLQHI